MKYKMMSLTSAEQVLYRAQFEFWYTVAGLDCVSANAKAYEKIVNARKIGKELKKHGL